ncbi:hypothetical protein AJ79_07030 [Helicocarpus griseus UAMH5409]|uniref:Diphthine--ammonia ligase n=1 Tax=Helicocarpus griseus UAMH5409 TaxID=1447875 RepID=A0A2B7X780_9EURO|nr:hypothetical protein AJ79_07030 [Helicocarpus griseus UAMH5409]
MSQQQLNVIALISGGKDSLYSILHCLKNGHKVVALANLHPPLKPTKPSPARAAYLASGTLEGSDSDQFDGSGNVVQKEEEDEDEDEDSSKPGNHDDLAPHHTAGKKEDEEEEDEEEEDEEEEEDLHSYMYQTVGHSIIPLYASALDIPLYRAPIHGTALNTSRDYQTPSPAAKNGTTTTTTTTTTTAAAAAATEETESLFHLLNDIKQAHPSANAVSAGAILSTYQRTRIENVAGRLNLTPLAWLWMYPSLPPPVERALLPTNHPAAVAGLLEDMAACGCEARIIKIASGGLDVDDLWGNVAGGMGEGEREAEGRVVRRRLVKGMGRFVGEGEVEGAVLGEGGEYESIALDGPGALWKGRIVVGRVERRVGEGGVAGVRILGARCVGKGEEGGGGGTDGGLGLVRVPQMFDAVFKGVFDEMVTRCGEYKGVGVLEEPSRDRMLCAKYEGWKARISQIKGENVWTVSNVCAPEAGPGAGNQMKAIAQKFQDLILQQSTTTAAHAPRATADIVFASVLLRSMDDFTLINPIYASLFTKPNPPARVTVACGNSMPAGVDVMASFVVDMLLREGRLGLHVQSRSYWAPANIGPYSQAQCIPLHRDARIDRDGGLIYVAGQIPLNPGTMEVYNPPTTGDDGDDDGWFKQFASRSILSLQHLWRIGRAMEADWWLGAVAFLAGEEQIPAKARIAWDIWERMNRGPSSSSSSSKSVDDDDDEDGSPSFDVWDLKYGSQRGLGSSSAGPKKSLPNFEVVRGGGGCIPPFFAVHVAALPRASDIEWQGLGTRSNELTMSEEEVTETELWMSRSQGAGSDSFYYIAIQEEGQSRGDLERCIRDAVDDVRSREKKAYGEDSVDHVNCTIYTPYCLGGSVWQLGQIVPCKSVWGSRGRRLAAGVVVHVRLRG